MTAQEEQKAKHWIYEINENNTCRFLLGTVGKNPLICIGVNPSTAEPEKLDNTVKSVERISEANGFDSWIMINLCPQRATNPDDMHCRRNYQLESENLIQIENIMLGKNPAIWAAWGTLITKRPYLLNSLYKIMDLSKENNCKWYNAGLVSKMGHPHHPLYLEKTIKLNEFDITQYVEKASIELAFSTIKNIKNNTLHSESDFLEVLDKAGFMDIAYGQYLSTAPINVEAELGALKNADFKHTKALLTMLMREDHFDNGALRRRIKNGDLLAVMKKLQQFSKTNKE